MTLVDTQMEVATLREEFRRFRGRCHHIGDIAWCLGVLFFATGVAAYTVTLWAAHPDVFPALVMAFLSLTALELPDSIVQLGLAQDALGLRKRRDLTYHAQKDSHRWRSGHRPKKALRKRFDLADTARVISALRQNRRPRRTHEGTADCNTPPHRIKHVPRI
jgi:hypothetical protein